MKNNIRNILYTHRGIFLDFYIGTNLFQKVMLICTRRNHNDLPFQSSFYLHF